MPVLGQPVRVLCEHGKRNNTWIYHKGDGFHYHKNRVKIERVFLKCAHYEKTGCSGRAVYSRGEGLRHTQPHSHAPDMHYPAVLRLRRRILQRCRSLEFVSYRRIIIEERRGQPREVKRRITISKMRSAMQRARSSRFPRVPASLEELTQILQDPRYRIISATEDAQDSLHAGSVTDDDGHHHIIFSSRRLLNVGKTLSILFLDGTFKTVPAIEELRDNLAAQVLVIVGNWDHTIIPIAWVLMSNHTQVAYEAVLRVLRLFLGGAPNLVRMITDFERGLRNACERIFPGVTLQGCFFHLVRAFIRYAKEVLEMGAALRDERVNYIMKLCCALSLLPERYMRRGFRLIMREALNFGRCVYRQVRGFLNYVLTEWLNNDVKRRWMCFFGSFHRTNNTCESHNKVLFRTMGLAHPNIYNFIGGIAALEDCAFCDAEACELGERPGRGRRASAIRNDIRLRNLSRQLLNPPGGLDDAIMRYLKAAVYTFYNLFQEAVNE